jgi:hypothetical protein
MIHSRRPAVNRRLAPARPHALGTLEALPLCKYILSRIIAIRQNGGSICR